MPSTHWFIQVRGALNRVQVLTEEERARGSVTFSAGNRGHALATAAQKAGCRAVMIMPSDAAAEGNLAMD
ncbi:MAG: pyridoxal-phosphate dependent enzyme [Chelatococcus sp.]|nr:pyridoxal-phosphate dependent enzyme [Chelatococcus sp. YT9]MBX3556116.1 pyridoxal-phosphate dependent enzyme [Chelatococcus sp.]